MLSVDQGQNDADAARRDMEFKRRSVSIKLLNINEDDDDEVRVGEEKGKRRQSLLSLSSLLRSDVVFFSEM